MNSTQEAPFDQLASRYDAIWSDSPIGKAQRSAVWNRVDPLFKRGEFVLDLGCGTGVDALHLQSRGVWVYGIDSSPRMVEEARKRGIDADCYPIEHLPSINMRFDGAISNFGALNCLPSLAPIARSLGRIVRRGGHLALCVLSPICLWELVFYSSQGKIGKAFRRLRGRATSSTGTKVFYPSGARIVSAFKRDFRLLGVHGVGLFVPPSYVTSFNDSEVDHLAHIDQRLANKPVLRSLADHRLYIFKRK